MGATVTCVGLGVMGGPIAKHLLGTDYALRVFNRSAEKLSRWFASADQHSNLEQTRFDSVFAAAQDTDFLICCVGDDDDLQEVIFGDAGALNALKPGAIVVDHSTISATTARHIHHRLAKEAVHFIDAPVSGGQLGAENGTLTVMCGGDLPPYQTALKVIDNYSSAVTHMGESGSGQLTKMVNQICLAGLIQSLAEGIQFAQRAGLNCDDVMRVIGQGAAQSWQLDHRHKSMIEAHYTHGFAVDLMRKDLAICLDEARKNGSQLPVAALVDQFYSDVQQSGGGRWDTSSLLTRLT